jgi:hypothetical protein
MLRAARASTALLATSLLILVAGPALAAPSPVGEREKVCSQAWATLAQEAPTLNAQSVAAWTRVSDAFLSSSDATFIGPLSNAFGGVSTAAADIAAQLTQDVASNPPSTAYDAALGAMGTVCARLHTVRHKANVAKFQRFLYRTGLLTGLSPEAGRRANATIARAVNVVLRGVKAPSGSPCFAAQRRCGYFVQHLRQAPCLPGLVCVRQEVAFLPVGANSSAAGDETFAFDALTGRKVPLTQIVPATAVPSFLAALNSAVQAKLDEGGIGDDPFWKPKVQFGDVYAWLPQPDGIHVWFDKYAVAPGSFGVVHVVAPLPSVPPVS